MDIRERSFDGSARIYGPLVFIWSCLLLACSDEFNPGPSIPGSQAPVAQQPGSQSVVDPESFNPEVVPFSDAYWAELAQSYPAFVPEPDLGAALGPTDRIDKGRWSSIIQWPQIAAGAANLPDGRIVTWSSTGQQSTITNVEFTHGSIFDPDTGDFTIVNNPAHDMFCAGVALLSDGEIMAAGGGATVSTTSLYKDNAWSLIESMEFPRWYPTVTTLPSGRAFSVLGDADFPYPEIWSAEFGWQLSESISLQSVLDDTSAIQGQRHWYPALNVTPTGSLFHPGPTSGLFSVNLENAGSVIPHGSRENGNPFRLYNTTVMYDVGKMLIAGGGRPALATAMSIDVNASVPEVTVVNSMNFPRAMHNSVVMPDGKVLVIGGNSGGVQFSDSGTQLIPEMWDPDTGLWDTLAPHRVPRNYHSTALLLKDGRVASMGGGICGGCATNHQDGEIYEPPYLFNDDGTLASRPLINGGPSEAIAGGSVQLTGSDDIVRFNMVRLVALTHHHTTDQRLVPIQFQQSSTGVYDLEMVDNPNVLIPGFYWVFGLNAKGVPSEGHTIKIGVTADSRLSPIEEPVSFEYYEGVWEELPDFEALTPVLTGKRASFLLSAARRPDHYALRFNSKLSVPVSGVYEFYLSSDDGSHLYINEQLVVDNDGLHVFIEKQGELFLEAGQHDIRVDYLEFTGRQMLEVLWSGPGFQRMDVTDALIAEPVPLENINQIVPTLSTSVDYEIYKGIWSLLPAFNTLTPESTGTQESFALTSSVKNTDNFAIRFVSEIVLPVGGQYTFYTTSDDGSQLFINGQLVVDNDGLHGPSEQQGSINLPSGTHDIVVTMFERGGGEVLEVMWSGPGFGKQMIAGPRDTAPSIVDQVDPVDPALSAAVNVEFFKGVWNSLPDFEALTPETTITQNSFSITDNARNTDNFAFRFTSEIEIPASGQYTFYTRSDDGSQLFINGQLIVDNDGLHGPSEKQGTVSLAVGAHDIVVTMFERGGGEVLEVLWSGPGFDKQIIASAIDAAPTIVDPDSTVENNLLSNSTFEENAAGWFSCNPNTTTAISDQASGGQFSLEMEGCVFTEFQVNAEETYSLSCHAKGNNTSFASITMSFSDTDFNELAAVTAPLVTSGFVEYSLQLIAPAGSVNGSVSLYAEGDSANFDDCMVVSNAAPIVSPAVPVSPQSPLPETPVVFQVPASNLLENSTFEDNTDGWNTCSVNARVSLSNQSHSGTGSLEVQGCAFAEFQPNADQQYRLSCSAQANNTSFAAITLSFSDSNFNRLGAVDVVLDSAPYKEYQLEFIAPQGSENAAVDIYVEGGAANLDNCVVVPI